MFLLGGIDWFGLVFLNALHNGCSQKGRGGRMVSGRQHVRVLLLLASASFCLAHIADFDESWQKRAAEAEAAAQAAYHDDPHSVTDHINQHVHRAWDESEQMETNSTLRRQLRRRYRGPCLATNPIDRCWRCDKNWAKNRKKLADCILGFGRKTIGGKLGRYYVVTDPSDDDLVNPRPGTLRYAVTRNESLWITFARDMIIRPAEEMIVSSYKTIDGRGAQVHIAHGAQITIQFAQHVIIHGLHIHDNTPSNGGMILDSQTHWGRRLRSDGDGISIFGSSNIWIDHVSMSNCYDGLIDAIVGSTAITISNSHFTHHNEVMLFGATDGETRDKVMQITLAFNHFGRGLMQRMPRGRYGFFHVLNNDYTHWEMYAIGGNQNPTIISQGNRYIAPPVINVKHNATEVTKREFTTEDVWKNWVWRSENDLMQNHAFFIPSGPQRYESGFSSDDFITAKPGSYVTRLTRFSGALACDTRKPC